MKFSCIDVESTGLDMMKDHPIQIAVQKFEYVDGQMKQVEGRSWFIRPPIPIPKFVEELTGITNEQVAGCPVFGQVAPIIREFIGDDILLTFNGGLFDIPFLNQKYSDVNMIFPNQGQQHVDVMRLYAKAFPRDLSSVYKMLVGADISQLGSAHDAMVDVLATQASFECLIDNHTSAIGEDLEQWVNHSKKEGQVDWAGKLYRNSEDVVCYTFGKNKENGQPMIRVGTLNLNYTVPERQKGNKTTPGKRSPL